MQTTLFNLEDKERDNIRADASVLMEMMSKIGASGITPEQTQQLKKFELQLGYPTGILSAYVNSAAKDIKVIGQQSVTMANGTQGVAIVSQAPDGTITSQTISFPGTVGKESTSTGSFTPEMITTASNFL